MGDAERNQWGECVECFAMSCGESCPRVMRQRRSEGVQQAVEMTARSLAQLDCRVCRRCGRQAYQHRAIAGIGAVCPVARCINVTE